MTKYANLIIYTFFYKFAGRREKESIMKYIGKNLFLQMIIGFFAGQVGICGMCVLGVAYFAAVFEKAKARLLLAFCVIAGMFLGLPMEMALCGSMVILSMLLIYDTLERQRIRIKTIHAALIAAVTFLIYGGLKLYMFPYNEYDIALLMFGTGLVLSLTKLFSEIVCYVKGGKSSGDKEYENIIGNRLNDFSHVFDRISIMMSDGTEENRYMESRDIRKIFREMSENVCTRCEKYEECSGQTAICRPEKFKTLSVSTDGCITLEQMPVEFARECIHCDRFLEEANQNLYIARNIIGYRNRVKQSRKAVANQMKEISAAVKNMLDSLPRMQRLSIELEEAFEKEFRKKRVICKNIYAYEKQDGQIEIIMNARTVKGRLVTATELSKIMSNIMQKRLKPSDASRKVIDTGFGEYIFVEETKYKVLTGVARLTKDGQSVSGDTFSMINLPSGELLMALSDGMGSGTSAFDDSKNVIELLEQMSEAGFSQTSAIRLINSLYMSDQEFENYATLDISLINLYKGECSFLKNGAVGTYVLNQGKMYCIEGQSLPMGVVSDAEPYIGKMSLYPGDYVIMMTDGVADMFSQERYNLEKFIKQIEIVNPGDMAQAIVDEAVSRNKGAVSDDMSVIVAGVWEN